MKKIKALLPSLRENKRYLVYDVLFVGKNAQQLSFDAVRQEIEASVLSFFGVLGTSKMGLMFLKNKWDKDALRGIVRVNNRYVDSLKTGIAFVKKIDGNNVILQSLGVSGTLKGAMRFMKKEKITKDEYY